MAQRAVCLLIALALFPISALAGTPSPFHNFAQIADGGGYRTVFLVLNPSSLTANVTLSFYDDNGAPLSLTVDGTTTAVATFTIAGGGSRTIATAGLAPAVRAGWAQLVASIPVGAQALFEVSSGGQLLTQAAVESEDNLQAFDVFFDQTGLTGTGVALANLSSENPIRVRLTIINDSGTTVATQDLDIPKLGHTAQFVSTLFGQAAGLRGRMRVLSSGTVAAVALQVTGNVLGSLPVVAVRP